MPRVRVASSPITNAVAVPAQTPAPIAATHPTPAGSPARVSTMPHAYAPPPNNAACPKLNSPRYPYTRLNPSA